MPLLRVNSYVSLPRHERGVDHVGHALPTDRLDREIDVLEPELVRGHLLQGKAVRCELRERKLTGAIAVTAGALDGDEFHRDLADREGGKFRHLALDHHGA